MVSIIYQGSYTKPETDNLLTNKLFNIGSVPLPGHLRIGTTYTSSIFIFNGYTGYELQAASSYDMFLNLQSTRTDGGWMYVFQN